MRTAIYCRVSTEEQGRPDHVSLETQAATCHEYADRNGWPVVGEYEDIQSGQDVSRPRYQEMLAAARDGDVDVILAYHPYRFGRNAGEAISSCNELASLGVQVQTVRQDISDPFVRGLMFLLGEKQSRDTSEHVCDSMRRLAAQGRWVSRAPLGYDVVKTPGQPGGVLVANDDAPLVARMFELYATGEYSMGDLQQEAAKVGLKLHGRVIDRQRINMLLRSVAYIGKVAYGRLSNGKFTGRRKHDEWIEVDGLHTAIVDQATWDAVQRRLQFNRDHATSKQTDYLLTSFIRCGRCHGRMYGQRLKRKSGTYYHQYRCQNGVEYRACTQHYVSGPRVDQAVRDVLAGLLPRVGAHARDTAKALVLQEATRQLAAERKEAGRLRVQRDKQVREMTKLTEGFIADRILPEVFDRMVADAKESIARIDAQLEVLARDDPAGGYRQSVEALWAMMERVPWPPAPDNFFAWRKVVELSVDFVEVFNREDVRVHLNAAAGAGHVNPSTKGGLLFERPPARD